MGLTEQYLAYHPVGSFNIIASANVNVSFVTYNKIDGRYVAVGAAEKVLIWDLRLGEKILEFIRGKEEVTALQPSPDRLHLAVGFSDGVVRIFNLQSTFGEDDSVPQFSLHRSGINVLRYDTGGNLALSHELKLTCNSLVIHLISISRIAFGFWRAGHRSRYRRHCIISR